MALPIRVAAVVPGLVLHDLRAALVQAPAGVRLRLTYAQERAVRDRVARLWSEARVWDPPVTVALPDGSLTESTALISTHLHPGPYIVEIAIEGKR